MDRFGKKRSIFWRAKIVIQLVVRGIRSVIIRCLSRGIHCSGTCATPTIIIISFIEWQGAFQRPQHLALELARAGYNVFYCSLLRIHRVFRNPSWLEYAQGVTKQNLHIITPLAFPLDSRCALMRFCNNAILYSTIKSISGRTSKPYIIVNAPFFNPVIFTIESQALLYDIMDELTEDKTGRRYKAAERELIKGATVVSCGTMAVSETKKSLGRDITFIAGGVDFEHFSRARDAATPVPDSLRQIKSPIAGYFGAVNERLDYRLIQRVAESLPQVQFVFIGPVSVSLGELEKMHNIYWLGWRSYEDLPVYLKAFDVALVPYRTVEGIEKVNPVKILEYCAGGKPVVSTALPDVLRFYGSAVYIARNPGEFAERINISLSRPESTAQRIQEGLRLARGRSWRAMAEEFTNLLNLPKVDVL